MEQSNHPTAFVGWNWAWRVVGRLGSAIIDLCSEVFYLVSVMLAVAALAIQPRRWRRTVRRVFARQLLHTGVNTIAPVGLIAFVVGLLVVMQAYLWLGKVGHVEWLGHFLVVVVIRVLSPLLTNLVIIIRNGSEMTVQLANMTQTGKVRMLDAQGIDPLIYLVMPRTAAMVVSAFCLTLLFIMFSFVSGYLSSVALGLRVVAPGIFLDQVLRALRPVDILNLLVTGLFPAFLISIICCLEGLNVPAASTAVPIATRRALSHSVAVLFLILALVSVLTYL